MNSFPNSKLARNFRALFKSNGISLSRFLFRQSQRADNVWLLGLFFLVNNTQSTLFPKLDHSLGKGLIVDAASKLSVENIDCDLAQRTIVDILDSTVKLWCIEECSFDLFSISLKTLIGSEAGP